MVKIDRNINAKILGNNMIKKILISLLLILSLFGSSFGATQNIVQCPTTWVSGDTYIINPNFVDVQCLITSNNVTLTSNDIKINKDIIFEIHNNNTTFKNLNIKSLKIIPVGNIYGLNLSNNIIYDSSYSLISSLLTTSPGNVLTKLILNNNQINFKNGNLFYASSAVYQSTSLTIKNIILTNNDFIGGGTLAYSYGGWSHYGPWTGGGYLYLQNITMDNNILGFNNFNYQVTPIFIQTNACNVSITNNNYLGWINSIDTNLDFLDDTFSSLSLGTCSYYNGFNPTKKTFNTDSSKQIYGYLANSPQYYDSNKRIYVTKSLILNGLSTGVDFSNIIGTTLDLSHATSLTLNGIKSLKMGNSNTITGGSTNPKPIITTTQAIISNYLGTPSQPDFYNGNYQLIDYHNNLKIDNIDFQMSLGQYALIRKNNLQTDGINLNLENNNFKLLFTPNNPGFPLIVSGCSLKVINNTFDLNGFNSYIFNDGRCGTLGGGHVIQSNTFNNGGYTFMNLQAGALSNNPILINNNKFSKTSNVFPDSQPFFFNASTPNNQSSLLKNVSLSGDYYYKTTCQNYKFNVGNYYNDFTTIKPLNSSNDINNNFIYDAPLLKGHDIIDNPILDFNQLGVYPYPFGTQIANALNVTNTCGALSFNILNPTQNAVYPSTTTFSTNWEFLSSTYNNLYCKENINGIEIQYAGVMSGINKGAQYTISDGVGEFQVKCSLEPTYTNLVFNSSIIHFQVGNLNTPIVVQPNPIVIVPNPNVNNTNPNTNNTNNNNNTFTNDFIYQQGGIIDTNSVNNTTDNTVGFMSNIMDFIVNIGMAIVPIMIVLVLFFAILRLLI